MVAEQVTTKLKPQQHIWEELDHYAILTKIWNKVDNVNTLLCPYQEQLPSFSSSTVAVLSQSIGDRKVTGRQKRARQNEK